MLIFKISFLLSNGWGWNVLFVIELKMEGSFFRRQRILLTILCSSMAVLLLTSTCIWYLDLFSASAYAATRQCPTTALLFSSKQQFNDSAPPVLDMPEVNAVYPDTTIEKEWIIIEDSSNGLTLVSYTCRSRYK